MNKLLGVGIAALLSISRIFAQQSHEKQIVKEESFEITLPAGWTKAAALPQGIDAGYTKLFLNAAKATFYFHYETMPSGAGEPPSDPSEMGTQWNALIKRQFSDARELSSPPPPVNGRILINKTYSLTDETASVTRRYTYFLAGRTAFVVQSTAAPEVWSSALPEFNEILGSLLPNSKGTAATVSDEAALATLKARLPTLVASFPEQWSCMVADVKLLTKDDKRSLEISLAFDRKDTEGIYKATKQIFKLLKEGKGDDELNRLTSDVRQASSEGSSFIKYVGQVWGCALGVVSNCKPDVDLYRVELFDPSRKRIGLISVSRTDAAAILTGKVTVSETRKLAGMYAFE